MKNKKQIAFWKYDQYPYTLWGTIEKRCKVDEYPGPEFYIVKEYGYGYFKPFLVIDEDKALPIIERLKELEVQYKETIDQTRKNYRILLKDIMPEHPEFK